MDVNKQQEEQTLLSKDSGKLKRFLLLGSFVMLRFMENLCSTLPSPFFARVMEQKDGTVFEAALSSRVRMLCFVILSPILGRYLTRLGSKRVLWIGIFGTVLAQASFGLLEFVNDLTFFVIGAMISRSLFGAFRAAHFVAANVIAFQEYPDRVSLVFGVLQAASGCGYLLGPGLGGILYDKLGMAIPVLGSATILLLCGLIPCCFITNVAHRQDTTTNRDISIRYFLFKPLVVATILLAISVFGILSYADVTLTLYFQDNGYSIPLAGVALLIWGTSFAGLAPIIGYCATKSIYVRRYAISIAAILYSCIMFAFAPNQLLSVIYVSCFALGCFCSISNVPSVEVLLLAASKDPLDRNSNPVLYGTIMGIWQSALGIGLLLPPVVASFIQSETSSSFTSIFYGLSIVNLVLAIVQFVLSVFIRPPVAEQ